MAEDNQPLLPTPYPTSYPDPTSGPPTPQSQLSGYAAQYPSPPPSAVLPPSYGPPPPQNPNAPYYPQPQQQQPIYYQTPYGYQTTPVGQPREIVMVVGDDGRRNNAMLCALLGFLIPIAGMKLILIITFVYSQLIITR